MSGEGKEERRGRDEGRFLAMPVLVISVQIFWHNLTTTKFYRFNIFRPKTS